MTTATITYTDGRTLPARAVRTGRGPVPSACRGGRGDHGVEFMPGQVVADRHSLRDVCVITSCAGASVFPVVVA